MVGVFLCPIRTKRARRRAKLIGTLAKYIVTMRCGCVIINFTWRNFTSVFYSAEKDLDYNN